VKHPILRALAGVLNAIVGHPDAVPVRFSAHLPMKNARSSLLGAWVPIKIELVSHPAIDRSIENGLASQPGIDRPIENGLASQPGIDRPIENGLVSHPAIDRPIENGLAGLPLSHTVRPKRRAVPEIDRTTLLSTEPRTLRSAYSGYSSGESATCWQDARVTTTLLPVHSSIRLFTAGLLGATLVAVSPNLARASDGGADAAESEDAAADAGTDATPTSPASDAAVAGPHGCVATGEACDEGQTCCSTSAYCGSFGGAGGALVCGLNQSNQLSTGSCSAANGAGGSTPGGLGFLGVVGLAIAVGVRKRRRS
jgi:MYXO-CTERM domain-containing protein